MVEEARWLASQGARELFLVSENSTSYGKDLGDIRLLETLLPELAAVDGVDRVRVSYLQPAETRPGLVETIARTPGVTPYFDLSFQHASGPVLRRMRRFGDAESFLGLLEQVRALAPEAGVRSNVIVGFPGETEADLEVLTDFLVAARMDVTGVFGYSDEDGTEAAGFDDKHDDDEVRARVAHVSGLVEELTAQRAEERIGETVEVLVESRRRRRGRRAGRSPGARGRRYDVPAGRRPRRRRRPGHRHRGGQRRGGPGGPTGEHAMSEQQAVSNWNLPNVLTGLRIVMVPFFGWALLHDGGDSILWRTVAFVLFVGAMITDKIDGDIARARNLVTNFGKIADPIADKAITGMAFIGLSIVGDIWWWVTIVVLLREWSVTLLRLSILKQVVVAAAWSGKVKTVLQAIALSTLLPAAAAGHRRAVGHPRQRDLLRRPGGPGRRRGRDDVVGLRVLPRRVAPARATFASRPFADSSLLGRARSPSLRVRVTAAHTWLPPFPCGSGVRFPACERPVLRAEGNACPHPPSASPSWRALRWRSPVSRCSPRPPRPPAGTEPRHQRGLRRRRQHRRHLHQHDFIELYNPTGAAST